MDAIERLARTPKMLAHLVAEVADDALDTASPGEWSARTILAHFRDDEYLCMRVALERMLAEDVPSLRFLEGHEWEPGRNRTRDRKEVLLAGFALQRQASLDILNGLRPEDLRRRGRSGVSEFSVEQFLESWAGHDGEHIAQLERAVGDTYEQAIERRMHRE